MVKDYILQYLPSALSTCSDYWRAAVIGGICTKLGNLELGVFNMSYRVLMITLTFISSLGIACGIKIASALGAGDSMRAKSNFITG